MFSGVKNDAAFRRLNRIGRFLGGYTANIHSVIIQKIAKSILQQRLDGKGKVNLIFARNMLMYYDYAQSHYHRNTGKSMMQDINDGKRIIIEYYK